MSTALDRLDAAPAVQAARAVHGEGEGIWIVGGAVRDALLGRPLTDVDLAVAGEPEPVARAIAGAANAFAFPISEQFAAWRVTARDGAWQIDVSGLHGPGVKTDLAMRDFTINAIAVPLPGGEPIDPHGGVADIEARRLRAVGEHSFESDPLRLLRAARFAAELAFEVDPQTAQLARRSAAHAGDPAGERQFAELRAIVCGAGPLRGLTILDEIGASAAVLPELEALKGVEQTPYHQHDAHGHTLEVLRQAIAIEGEGSLEELFGEHAAATRELLAEPIADEIDRAGALRFAALLHDIGKPATRAVRAGRVTFLGHDTVGAEMTGAFCERMRTSRRLRTHLQHLTRSHLHLGFLVRERPLPRRRVYEYLLATDPAPVDVTLLTVADRLATRSAKVTPEAMQAHLGLAREVIGDALRWQRDGPARSPASGDELIAALGVAEGPELGDVLRDLAAAAFAGEITTKDQAIQRAANVPRK
jgi:poly(A) polymerase